jgi:hypothetical protein
MLEEERVSEPTFFQDIADRIAVAGGNVRVRIFPGGAEGVVRGRTPGPPPERILKLVLELGPGGAGTVDLRNEGGRWRIRASEELGGDRFEQRLRNVLGNP